MIELGMLKDVVGTVGDDMNITNEMSILACATAGDDLWRLQRLAGKDIEDITFSNKVKPVAEDVTEKAYLEASSVLRKSGGVYSPQGKNLYRLINADAEEPQVVGSAEELYEVLSGGKVVESEEKDAEKALEDEVEGEKGKSAEDLYKETEEKEEEKAKEVGDDEVEDVELKGNAVHFSSYINNKVKEFMETYKLLYQPCYTGNRPKGILTPEGLFTLNGKVTSISEESRAELAMVYNIIEETVGHLDGVTRFNSKVSPKGIEEGDGIPLYPMYHLANMYGYFGNRSQKATTYKEFAKYMEERTVKILRKMVSELDDETLRDRPQVEALIMRYLGNLENCILVDDYVPSTVLKLRISLDVYNRVEAYNSLTTQPFQDVIDSGYLFQMNTTLDMPSKDMGVTSINFIVDANTYYNSPLFAYESLPIIKEQGIKLSWSNVLIGKDTKDNLVFGKFGSPQKTIYNILAGSGSGKGVMTLNLLASALAANMPVMYSDCKPDMAKVLWDVAGGREVLAFDGDGQGTLEAIESKVNIYEYFNTAIPEEVRNALAGKGLQKTFVKTYCYIKSILLACLITILRKDEQENRSEDDQILFIFDEVGRVAGNVRDLSLFLIGDKDGKGGFVQTRKDDLKAKGLKPVEIAKDESIKYARDVIKFFIEVINLVDKMNSAELRKSNSNLLFIWQPEWVESASLSQISATQNPYYFMSRVYNLVSNSKAVKFAGKGADKTNTIGMEPVYNKSDITKQLFDNFRYFTISDGAPFSESSTVFRPFLLLNGASEMDANQVCSTNPLARSKVYKNGSDGEIIPEIGFPQYVNKLLGGNVQDPLCRSWDLALNALEHLGYEKDIYKFMFNVADLSLQAGDNATTFDSTASSKSGDGAKPKLQDYSDLLLTGAQEIDFSDEEKQAEVEDAAMKQVFGEYKEDYLSSEAESKPIDWDEPIDLSSLGNGSGGVGSSGDMQTTSAEELLVESTQRGGEQSFTDTVKEAEALINRLKELGVNVSINGAAVEAAREEQGNMLARGLGKFVEAIPINRRSCQEENLNALMDDGMSAEDNAQANPAFFGRAGNRSEIEVPVGTGEEFASRLGEIITKDIIKTYGGTSKITTIAISGNGSFAVNKCFYRCKLKNTIELPYDVRQKVNAGEVAYLVDWSAMLSMPNLKSLVCEDIQDFEHICESLELMPTETEHSYIGEMAIMIFRGVPSMQFMIINGQKLRRSHIDEDLEAKGDKLDKISGHYHKSDDIAKAVQGTLFKGASMSWSLTTNSIKRKDLKAWKRVGGVLAGTTGTVLAGLSGTGTFVGRKVLGGVKGFARGVKNLLDN